MFSDENIQDALSCIEDLERRTCLHLAWLRINPFVTTPCCDSEFCFKCKVGTHHTGETCEQRQREELDIYCQFCPECEVATVRTEGCDHIVCLCGAEWTWQECAEVGWALGPIGHLREYLNNGKLDPNFMNAEDGGRTLLMYAAGAGYLQNAKVLVEAGADITLRIDQGSALLHAFGVESAEYHPVVVDFLREQKAEVTRDDLFIWIGSQGNGHADAPAIFDRLLQLSGVAPAAFAMMV